ncbi:MAG: hypothetical protein LBQ00_05355 [Syntrophobacterales bacterium]|jgi:hypothetical protein|nr:hypothetical protein [Syntrophobacterales bacterium]
MKQPPQLYYYRCKNRTLTIRQKFQINYLKWISPQYKYFLHELKPKESIEKEDATLIVFVDNIEIVELFDLYKEEWNKWAEKQKVYDLTRQLYKDLFSLREELKANPETREFVVGNGEMSVGSNRKHPIITKKVSIEFDMASNSLQILDNDTDTLFYNELLLNVEDISADSLKTYRDILANNPFHPLSEQDAKNFLSQFAFKLSSDTIFVDNPCKQDTGNYRITIKQNPAFFLRKKIDGTLQFIKKIIEDINNGGNLMPSLPPHTWRT